MPAPRENPLRLVPRSVSDSIDGDNSAPGAMSSLMNLIQDPSTPNIYYCRPANLKLTVFPGFTSPGVVSVGFEVNSRVYGMLASGSPAGKDTPFVYDLVGNAFIAVSGITSANTPTTQATTGAWTPPDMDMVGQRIIVTHPGFNFAGGYAFGYFDISSFTETTTGDITSGSPTVKGAPVVTGLSPGYTITGTGIPANTTILNYANFNLTTTGDTNSSTSVTNVANTTGLAVGQSVVGIGIPIGAVITNISGATVTISAAATATAVGISLFFTGTTITMSANASVTTNGVTLTIAGGTSAAPLWAAGNTSGATQLASIAHCIRQFNNRAYFAASNNLIFTDTLSLNISNANGVQVLTIGDGTTIQALEGLPEYTSSTGVLQALLVFKKYYIGQVNGDAATSDLALNALSDTVGTDAPRSVCATPSGVVFKAPDGLRLVNLIGEVSEPDPDLALPFIYAQVPSRIAACYNANIYRICVQNTNVIGSPYQDYHYNFKYKSWTGPHSFKYDMALAYNSNFILFTNALPATMWESFSAQGVGGLGTTFVENGVRLTWQYATVPITDTGNMYTNAAVRTTLDLSMPATGDVYIFQALDENSGVLAIANIQAPLSQAVWNAFNWGDGTLWGAQQFGLQPFSIPWTQPLIFNKLVFQASGNSALGFRVGALYNGYEKLGYLNQ